MEKKMYNVKLKVDDKEYIYSFGRKDYFVGDEDMMFINTQYNKPDLFTKKWVKHQLLWSERTIADAISKYPKNIYHKGRYRHVTLKLLSDD